MRDAPAPSEARHAAAVRLLQVYSRAVRRFDWGAEYTVPEPEVEELESHWCEVATASRSVRKRSPWLQLPGRGE